MKDAGLDTAGVQCATQNPALWSDEDAAGEPIAASLLARPVLIIEDEVMIAWMLESLLEDMGFADVRIVANGADAVAAAQTRAPGLILSDINLESSDMDGVQASATIAADTDAVVLFITAYADAADRDRIMRDIPAAVILRKPVEPAQLRKAIVASSPAGRLQ